ncbi:hypothetical protein VNI00_010312 [Paramarasmius palmivorus]|uniref:Uncharacterized protein n=1 Tax=Paramarasmius palmivorus TaxID=297713 RepID=A0AAW0CJM4_9AGAR
MNSRTIRKAQLSAEYLHQKSISAQLPPCPHRERSLNLCPGNAELSQTQSGTLPNLGLPHLQTVSRLSSYQEERWWLSPITSNADSTVRRSGPKPCRSGLVLSPSPVTVKLVVQSRLVPATSSQTFPSLKSILEDSSSNDYKDGLSTMFDFQEGQDFIVMPRTKAEVQLLPHLQVNSYQECTWASPRATRAIPSRIFEDDDDDDKKSRALSSQPVSIDNVDWRFLVEARIRGVGPRRRSFVIDRLNTGWGVENMSKPSRLNYNAARQQRADLSLVRVLTALNAQPLDVPPKRENTLHSCDYLRQSASLQRC